MWKMDSKTDSEETFERYLRERGLVYERIPTTEEPQPDYRLQHNARTCVFEVKEFEDPAIWKRSSGPIAPPIRKKISRAAEKFQKYRDCCCSPVLWTKSIYRPLRPEFVLSAAFGAVDGKPEPLSDKVPVYLFSGSALLNATTNRTISAIVILHSYVLNYVWVKAWQELNRKKQRGLKIDPAEQFEIIERLSSELDIKSAYEGTIRAIVLENPHARIEFPGELFTGPFDQHWRQQSGWFELAFIGSELQKLKADGVPFIFL